MKIVVLMSTYNGEKYIREQIDSILAQRNIEVVLMVRDDGSTDNTKNILKEYQDRIILIEGQNLGFRKSFMWLIDNAPFGDYYAFADQDDVWEENKLISALKKIQYENQNIPLMYTSALTCVDEKLNYLRKQDFPKLKLSFYSEVVRHRFAGCTYVMNRKLIEICKGASEIEDLVYGHDGFVCVMCWLSGGRVIYDDNSYIKFRRHGDNVSVDGMGIKRRIKNELAFIGPRKNYKLQLFSVIWRNYNNIIIDDYKNFVKEIVNYPNSCLRRIRLAIDPRFDCGIAQANFLFRLSIILGCM